MIAQLRPIRANLAKLSTISTNLGRGGLIWVNRGASLTDLRRSFSSLARLRPTLGEIGRFQVDIGRRADAEHTQSILKPGIVCLEGATPPSRLPPPRIWGRLQTSPQTGPRMATNLLIRPLTGLAAESKSEFWSRPCRAPQLDSAAASGASCGDIVGPADTPRGSGGKQNGTLCPKMQAYSAKCGQEVSSGGLSISRLLRHLGIHRFQILGGVISGSMSASHAGASNLPPDMFWEAPCQGILRNVRLGPAMHMRAGCGADGADAPCHLGSKIPAAKACLACVTYTRGAQRQGRRPADQRQDRRPGDEQARHPKAAGAGDRLPEGRPEAAVAGGSSVSQEIRGHRGLDSGGGARPGAAPLSGGEGGSGPRSNAVAAAKGSDPDECLRRGLRASTHDFGCGRNTWFFGFLAEDGTDSRVPRCSGTPPPKTHRCPNM